MKQKVKTTWKRGLAAATAAILTLSAGGLLTTVNSFNVWADDAAADNTVEKYSLSHETAEDYEAALRAHGVKEGKEGLVLAQNENSALPLAPSAKVAVFGTLGYGWAKYTGGPAGNSDRKTLAESLTAAGFDVNSTITKEHFSGGGSSPNADPSKQGVEAWTEQSSWSIDKAATTGIVVLGRGGAEGTDFVLNDTTNPLALTDNELSMVDYAKEHCSKVVVLIVTANAMELGPIVKGGAHEVDAICYGAQANDYSYEGYVEVLAGNANATGGMNDTFVYENSYNPGNINYGKQEYAVKPNGDNAQYNNYVVEAEGIYIGYKYYETRYYDAKVNPSYNATATAGSVTGNAWDYSKEVVFTFGHGLSYYSYTQEITNVKIDYSENGVVDATVRITNKSSTTADFTAQLYVSRPYTQYDIEHHIEKSAVDFLGSARAKDVPANNGHVDVHIKVPTKYLASWDSEGYKTWLLDKGDYYFTAAAGAHEAVNNVLAAQGKTGDDTNKYSTKAIKSNLKNDDKTTFAVSHMSGYDEGAKGSGVKVTNVADGVNGTAIDINYYLPNAVKYLTRSNWQTTFPKNYTNSAKKGSAPEAKFDFSNSAKYQEWFKTIMTTGDYELKNQDAATLEAIKNTDEIITGKLFENSELKDAGYNSYWDFIVQAAVNYPEEFDNVYSDVWKYVIDGLSLNDAAGSIFHGGSSTDLLKSIQNPASKQYESVFGKSGATTKNGIKVNIASNTLLGCAMDPDLWLEWGRLEGEGERWTSSKLGGSGTETAGTVWGAGLNIHRTAYNGRNSEYVSEDPMLANRLGYYQQVGVREKGAIMGPKHMGFNTQETQRQGIANYMTEQTMRETDMRCYQGALSEGDGLGVMLSFSRIGATNAVHHAGIMNKMVRYEWGFKGIMTTDMGQKPYMQGTAMAMASVNQFADFAAGDSGVGERKEGEGKDAKVVETNYNKNGAELNIDLADSNWADITLRKLAADQDWCKQARLTETYEIYALAHTWNVNIGAKKPAPSSGKKGCKSVIGVGSAALASTIIVAAAVAVTKKKKD